MREFFAKLIVSVFFICTCLIYPSAQGVNQIWGTAPNGGNPYFGTIFSVDSSGNNLKTRYSFSVQNQGFGQGYTQLVEWNGKFYGITNYGGGGTGLWQGGVLFEWDPATNVYTTKTDFLGWPSDLIVYNGKFYCTIANEYGTDLIEYDPVSNRSEFGYIISSIPNSYASRLTFYNGKYYGTVSADVSQIFEWDPSARTLIKKVDFDSENGASLYGGLTLYNSKFYGMAQGGGNGVGTIYEWDPSTNMITKKFDFSIDGSTGKFPVGSLIFHGTRFYGMTPEGGLNNGGVLFEWDPVTNVFTKRFDFNTGSGIKPYGHLTVNNGKLYGLTHEGGDYDGGSIFEWDPTTNTFTKKIDLSPAQGSNSKGSLLASGGLLYGMTDHGGQEYNGVLFQWNPATNTYLKKVDLHVHKGYNPILKLVHKNGKFYGVTADMAGKGKGVLFEWDQSNNSLTEKVNFSTVNGRIPSRDPADIAIDGAFPFSTPVEKDGKFYGITIEGGINNSGVIYEWDPATNIYTKKIDLSVRGDGPIPSVETSMIAGMVLYNNHFYGTLPDHGGVGQGELFEWDPVTNIYTKKIDFTTSGGSFPNVMTLYNGKFYGTTIAGGANDKGVLFEWDPVTNIYTKKLDFATGNNGYWPKAGLVVLNEKMYGSTYAGGINDLGVLFEWDPAINSFTKKIDCSEANGSRPAGSMLVSGQKLYGLTTKGGFSVMEAGVLFEWDPSDNTYTLKQYFYGDNGQMSYQGDETFMGYNSLVLVPAPVAAGTSGVCAPYSPVVIDNTNNNSWVPLVDDNGDVIAEIKGNGNNLGTINYSLYVHNGTVREDASHRLYLDRNLTITPQNQPSTPVDVRLYITEKEFQALKNATNSQGQPSAINTINDVGFFKNGSSTCSGGIQANAINIPAIGQTYNGGYVISASISSFSSFYFAKNTFTALPIDRLEFNVQASDNDVIINWLSSDQTGISHFEIERSEDGRFFTTIGKIAARNSITGKYNFIDVAAMHLPARLIYYRLKQIDYAGKETYSMIVPVSLNKKGKNILNVYPNPADNELGVLINSNETTQIKWSIIDNAGMILLEGSKHTLPGSSNITINIASLSRGIYYIKVQGTMVNEQVRFIKK